MSHVKTIREIEAALRSALGGKLLVGLPNLGNRKVVFEGARVRGDANGRLVWPANPHDETRALVLLPDGSLAVTICKTGKSGRMVPHIDTRAVDDEELHPMDVIDLWRTLCVVLAKHTVKTGGDEKTHEVMVRALNAVTGWTRHLDNGAAA